MKFNKALLAILSIAPTVQAHSCGCWTDADCYDSTCGDSCKYDWTNFSYRCFQSYGPNTTPSPTSPQTQSPTPPTGTPSPTPTGNGEGQVQTIPDECDVNDLISLMDQAIRTNKAIAPQWLRLAFHDAGTFNIQTLQGGANGCLLTHLPMRDQDENHNLDLAIETLLFIREAWGINASAADMIQFAGFFVAIRQRGNPGLDRPKMDEIIADFFWGRPDETNCNVEWTLNLPGFELNANPTDVSQRCSFAGGEVKNKMMDRNGFTAEEATALIGAHTIGLTRNVFGPSLQGPWVANGADGATPEGPVFDNGYHNFLVNNVEATSVENFSANRLSFDQDFPNWFRAGPSFDSPDGINHLDTDVVLAFPSENTNVHPHFNIFTQAFANDNQRFIDTFMRALDKMSRLGVTPVLFPAMPCINTIPPPPPPTPTDHTGTVLPSPTANTFDSDLAASIQAAEEKLLVTAVERQDEIEALTTPVNI